MVLSKSSFQLEENVNLIHKMPTNLENIVMVNLIEGNRFLGFKFVLPTFFPFEPPMVFLDEPENPMVIEFIDYLQKGNKIFFKYLQEW